MQISRSLLRYLLLTAVLSPIAFCQDSAAQPTAKVPLDRVIGTITAVQAADQTVTVNDHQTS
jgi:hypothetical protein